jgi:glycosyltransferase involved in cell wall biosynthesis
LRIAVLNRHFSSTGGGAERYSIALVEALAARHEIHVFAQQLAHQWPGVHYHRVSAPFRKPRWVNQLWFATATWWATRSGFDVVHSHENTWHGDVQTVHVLPVRHNLFQARHGGAVALGWLKVALSPRLSAYLILERLRYRARPGRRIVVTSGTIAPVMAASYPQSAAVMSVITPGINLPDSPTLPARRRAARSALGLPEDGRLLLFVGNDYRKKGLDTLLDALARLAPETRLAVVGNESQRPAFEARARTLGLTGSGARVFFLGSLTDMRPAYEAADALVHPTLEDTFAMVVLEAMSHGLPVVVSAARYCGIASLLTHRLNAWVLGDPLDAAALSGAIEAVFEEPGLQSGLSEAASKFAAQYQWPAVAALQEALYVESVSARTAAAVRTR